MYYICIYVRSTHYETYIILVQIPSHQSVSSYYYSSSSSSGVELVSLLF
jgi:hypothetical protein